MCHSLDRVNNIVSSCCLNVLNCVSSCKSAGKLFHTRGPVTERLLSLKVLCVHGTKHVLSLAEQRFCRPRSPMSWMLTAKYASVWPDNDWWTTQAILNWTCWWTDNQCNWLITGVMWSSLLTPVTDQWCCVVCRSVSAVQWTESDQSEAHHWPQANVSAIDQLISQSINQSFSRDLFANLLLLMLPLWHCSSADNFVVAWPSPPP